jgi:hypothetical protein
MRQKMKSIPRLKKNYVVCRFLIFIAFTENIDARGRGGGGRSFSLYNMAQDAQKKGATLNEKNVYFIDGSFDFDQWNCCSHRRRTEIRRK